MIRKTREHGRAYTFSPFLLERFTKFSTLKKIRFNTQFYKRKPTQIINLLVKKDLNNISDPDLRN
jgi:hypothetical protein